MATTTTSPTDRTDEQKAICEMVRQFADEQIIPNAEHYDHEDEFPEPIVEQMKELGLFGVTIPEDYGGMGLDLTTYAMIVEELSRGWISISGVVNTHFIGSYLLMKFGSDEQKEHFLPKMATGEIRAAFSLSEPEVGSDVWVLRPGTCRSVVAVTVMVHAQFAKPHSASAERWLRAAPGPQASTAAEARSSAVLGGRPTA